MVGKVGYLVCLLQLHIVGVILDELVDELLPVVCEALDLGEVVAKGDAGDDLVVVEEQVVSVFCVKLLEDELVKIFLNSVLAGFFILIAMELVQPVVDLVFKNFFQL